MRVLSEPKRAQNKEKDGQSYQGSTKLKGRRSREEEDVPKTCQDPDTKLKSLCIELQDLIDEVPSEEKLEAGKNNGPI